MAEQARSGSSSPPSKEDGRVRMTFESTEEDAYELSEYAVAKKWRGTPADRKDMSQLGRVQQLRVSGECGHVQCW